MVLVAQSKAGARAELMEEQVARLRAARPGLQPEARPSEARTPLARADRERRSYCATTATTTTAMGLPTALTEIAMAESAERERASWRSLRIVHRTLPAKACAI